MMGTDLTHHPRLKDHPQQLNILSKLVGLILVFFHLGQATADTIDCDPDTLETGICVVSNKTLKCGPSNILTFDFNIGSGGTYTNLTFSNSSISCATGKISITATPSAEGD